MGGVLYIFFPCFSGSVDVGGQLLGSITPLATLAGTLRVRATITGTGSIDG